MTPAVSPVKQLSEAERRARYSEPVFIEDSDPFAEDDDGEQPSPEHLQRGDAIATLLEAVTCGATLEIQGPTLDVRTVKAWIESATGSRHAEARGDAIGPVLVELADRWKAQSAPEGTR